jgi:type I restriction-modification system DNA methylase subunit
VLAAGRLIEARIPILDGVITHGLGRSPRPDDLLLRQTLDLLSAASNETPLEDLFLEALQRLTASDRSFGAHETRSDLAELMIRLVRHNSGTIFDPAAGLGGLLQMAALHPDFPSLPAHLIGYEVNERVARLARAQCFLYGMVPQSIGDTRIECRDSLREAATLDVEADLVLLDPPLNLREWGDTDLYLDHETWRFGLPSPRSAEFAWVQLAINALKPNGRAIVVLPALAASTGGRDERIRRNLVRAGCIETVVFLPARFGGDSSVPLSVWILRRPSTERADDTEPSRAVLLVDATPLGARSPLDQWADELDIDDIVAAAHSGSDSHMDPSLVIAVSTELIAEDGNLSFRHYQPLPAPPDLNDLEREVDELAQSVGDSTKQLSERVLELSRLLKESS